MNIKRNRKRVSKFIGWTTCFDEEVTKPLEHIAHNYELTWDHDAQKFEEEELSFARILNLLIDELAKTPSYDDYHKFVDDELMASRFAIEVIFLEGKRWKESKTSEPLKPEDIVLAQGNEYYPIEILRVLEVNEVSLFDPVSVKIQYESSYSEKCSLLYFADNPDAYEVKGPC